VRSPGPPEKSTVDPSSASTVAVEQSQAGRILGLDELLILNALWQERSLTTPQASRLLQKPEPDARAVLERLVEMGLVEARGERKGRTYHLSAATYRRLGLPSAYVRRRGFEPIQQEQMVLQYMCGRMGELPDGRRRNCARFRSIRHIGCYRGWLRKGYSSNTERKRGMVFATRLNNRTPFQHNFMRLYNRGRA
jgi:hypothetical protein